MIKIRQVIQAAIAATFLMSLPVQAKTLEVNPSRTIHISGPIGAGAIFTANKLLEFKGKEDIFLVINSPGGGVAAGLQIVSVIRILQNRGIKVRCVVPMLAASMAFQILAECSERYVFANTLLLWHPLRIRYEGVLTPKMALDLYRKMRAFEVYLVEPLIKAMKIERKVFFMHYYLETMHLGSGLNDLAPGFLILIDDVTGVKTPFSMRR